MGEELKLILSNSLKALGQGEFQVLCLSFLPIYDQRYEGLRRHGGTTEGKTRWGTPDLLKTDSEGTQIAVQCSTEDKYWRKPKDKTKIESWKPCIDIIKCVNELKGLNEIVLCTTKEIPTNAPNVERDVIAFGRTKTKAKITIITLYTLEEELFNKREKYIRVIEQYLSEFYKCLPKIKYFESLDEKVRSGRDFSPKFPKLDDFKNKLVYLDESKSKDVLACIENKNMCLLCGKPAAGKTVFAIAFAFEKAFTRSYVVYYLDIKGELDPVELLKEMRINNSPLILFIIDNCHVWPEKVYNLIKLIEGNNIKSKILFISRSIKSFLDEGENYFEVLKGCTISIKATETVFKNIINLYEEYKCKGMSDYTRKEYDVNAIKKRCGDDLFILYYFLEAWNPNETRKSLDEVKDEEILNKISEKYLEPYDRKIERNRLLVSLSALFQFEFPIESPFFYSKTTDLPKDDREDILKEGLIEVQIAKEETLYSLPHSTFAGLILKTVEKKHKELMNLKNAQDFTEEICLEYLATKPKYILNVFRLLFNNNRKDIAQKYTENDYFVQKVNELFSKIGYSNIQKWLNVLNQLEIPERYREKILDNETSKEIADRLQTSGVQSYCWVLRELLKLDKLKAKLLFEYSRSTLKDRLKDENFTTILKLFYNLTKIEISPEVAKGLLDANDNESFLHKIGESNLTNFGILLKHLARIDRSLALNNYFLNRLTAEKLSGILKRKKVTIQNLGDIFRYSNRNFATKFGSFFDEAFLIQAYNDSKLNQIGNCHHRCSRYCLVFGKVYETFERDYLYRKLQDSSIRDIEQFIYRISKIKSIGTRLAKNAINKLKKIDLEKTILRGEFKQRSKNFEPTELNDITWLIHNVSLIQNPDFITNQLKNVDLTLQIEGARLETISHFVWNVFIGDKELAREYCKIVYKSGLKEKIEESTLNEINLFLWNIYQIAESLPDVFINDEIRKILIEKSKEENSIDLLQTIGVFETAECSMLYELPEFSIDTSLLVNRLEYYLESSPFALLRTLKGLISKDKKTFFRIFQGNFELRDKILDFLKVNFDPEVTIQSRKLVDEVLDFLERIK